MKASTNQRLWWLVTPMGDAGVLYPSPWMLDEARRMAGKYGCAVRLATREELEREGLKLLKDRPHGRQSSRLLKIVTRPSD
jgi:hypothetical protein